MLTLNVILHCFNYPCYLLVLQHSYLWLQTLSGMSLRVQLNKLINIVNVSMLKKIVMKYSPYLDLVKVQLKQKNFDYYWNIYSM